MAKKRTRKKRSHIHLLYDMNELTNLLVGTLTVDDFLKQAAEMVARHLDAHVCSIYLYDESSDELYLAATTGLDPEAVGQVRMKVGDGIVGHCVDRLKPVCEGVAEKSPYFKYFRAAREDRFKSFLVVPIHRGPVRIGALVVQHEEPDMFDESDIMGLLAASSQLGTSIENARMIMEMNRSADGVPEVRPIPPGTMIRAGIASEGYAYAPATVLRKGGPLHPLEPSPDDEFLTLEDFHRAMEATFEQLQALQSGFARRLPESASLIFATHFMMLKDDSFAGQMVRLMKDGMPPMQALRQVSSHYTALLLSSPHEYIREKVNDIEDLSVRIMRNLRKAGQGEAASGQKRIVMAEQLYPSDILKLVADDVQGIVLAGGGTTAHVSILSKSLQIPLLMTDRRDLLLLPEDTPVLMDAYMGAIYVDPPQKIVKRFREREKTRSIALQRSAGVADETATRDGARVRLMANVNLLSEIPLARKLKAEGVGLYRTEFPFLIRTAFPSEAEQLPIYRRLFEEMKGRPVTIRTLDVGGEKVLPYLDAPPEPNPELGLRSIRFTLSHRDIFTTQIRAILRAAAGARDARIMFPMISSLDEFLEARQVVFSAMEELSEEKLDFCDRPSIGMMVELPSLVDIMDELADVADFFAIGTNDFVQYMLAVDRTNHRVSQYYASHHPAVLRGLDRIVRAADRKGKEVSICGEMAHEKAHLPFLLGIGIRLFSVNPQFLPQLQESISRISLSEAREYAGALLSGSSLKRIQEIMADRKWKERFGL
jgi:phosphotransferase system enzyme I (PtsP)